MENEIKTSCKLKMLCYFAVLQLSIIALIAIAILYYVIKTGKHVLLSPNGVQFGYFAELDESAEASKFAAQVQKAIEKPLKSKP